MSEKKEEIKKLEEEVVMDENNTTELVSVEGESKTSKVKKIVKTGLKVAGIGAIGIVGYLIGYRLGSKSPEEESEVIEAEIVDDEE